jgi:VacB/RNase II family 3'-5' exoribonuclease
MVPRTLNQQNNPHDLRVIARKAMIDRGLEPDFPADAITQLKGIQGPARETSAAMRDLRHYLWCSIDNDTSKDLDQLTVAEKLAEGRVKVLVAIADVDVLVNPKSPIDRHAKNNTTSVYTAAQIFPMLPEKLSTDLTSLGEAEERLALVIEMVVAGDGCVQEFDIYRAVVKNYAKLAYRSVAEWLDGKEKMPEKIARIKGLDDQLRIQDEIAHVMRSVRYQHGALELETIEPEAVLKDGDVADLRIERKNRAQELIEDFMIAANGVAAQFLDKRGAPSLRRVVREPKQWDRIRQVAREAGEQLPANPDCKALAEFLARRRQADPLRFPDLSLTIIKLLGPGEYVLQHPGEEAAGHFGLAVRQYSHSTAPNRRFPDLITQRLLKAVLAGDRLPYDPSELASLATHCTDKEDAAKKVERQVRKSAAAQLLSDRIGETFDAIVTGAADKGTWVRLLKPPAEGKLTVGHQGVRVGDKIKVRLSSINVERGFIDFVRSAQ